MLTIRDYQDWDEDNWLRCHALVAVQSTSWSNILRQKPHYEGPTIELVAVLDGEIVGFFDGELETQPGELCLPHLLPSAQTWEIGVHPSHWGTGIGRELLHEALARLRLRGVRRLEFWTRDERSKGFFSHMGAKPLKEYYQVQLDPRDANVESLFRANSLTPIQINVHVPFNELAHVQEVYRVTEVLLCSGFDLKF